MPDHVMNYVECDLPTGLTLPEWRRARYEAQPVRTRRSVRRFLRSR
jgi:hypothetical protein